MILEQQLPSNVKLLLNRKLLIDPYAIQVSDRLRQLRDAYPASFRVIALSGYYKPTLSHDLPRHLANLVLTYGIDIYRDALELLLNESLRLHVIKRIESEIADNDDVVDNNTTLSQYETNVSPKVLMDVIEAELATFMPPNRE